MKVFFAISVLVLFGINSYLRYQAEQERDQYKRAFMTYMSPGHDAYQNGFWSCYQKLAMCGCTAPPLNDIPSP